MKKIILLLIALTSNCFGSGVEGSGGAPANSTNATATEYIILLCATPTGSVIDTKQSNSENAEAAYAPECSAKAATQNTDGQVVRAN